MAWPIVAVCSECGKERQTDGKSKVCRACYLAKLKRGGTENPRYRHGKSHWKNGTSAEYRCWSAMKTRCLNPRANNFKNYGARGITVCERWLDFANFYADMGSKPSPGHTIERIDNDGNYEPSNCRWATKAEQVQNQRPHPGKVRCKRGHEFTEENTYRTPNGIRQCRICIRLRHQKRKRDRRKCKVPYSGNK